MSRLEECRKTKCCLWPHAVRGADQLRTFEIPGADETLTSTVANYSDTRDGGGGRVPHLNLLRELQIHPAPHSLPNALEAGWRQPVNPHVYDRGRLAWKSLRHL